MTELADTFLPKLSAVLKDLQQTHSDEQLMMQLGSLVQELLDTAGTNSWTGFKAGLSGEAYDELLGSFERNGKKMLAEGNEKAAYVLQAAGISLIASRLTADERIAQGNALLDGLINQMAARYRKARADVKLN